MFVGMDLAGPNYRSKVIDNWHTGTAYGDLGRHTQIGAYGFPIFDRRTKVFMEVHSNSVAIPNDLSLRN